MLWRSLQQANDLQSHSRSFILVLIDRKRVISCSSYTVTISLSCTVFEILALVSTKLWEVAWPRIHVTCSPRPPTLSQCHMDLHVWSYPRHSYIFEVSSKSVWEFSSHVGSKFASPHLHLAPLLGVTPLEFHWVLWHQNAGVLVL